LLPQLAEQLLPQLAGVVLPVGGGDADADRRTADAAVDDGLARPRGRRTATSTPEDLKRLRGRRRRATPARRQAWANTGLVADGAAVFRPGHGGAGPQERAGGGRAGPALVCRRPLQVEALPAVGGSQEEGRRAVVIRGEVNPDGPGRVAGVSGRRGGQRPAHALEGAGGGGPDAVEQPPEFGLGPGIGRGGVQGEFDEGAGRETQEGRSDGARGAGGGGLVGGERRGNGDGRGPVCGRHRRGGADLRGVQNGRKLLRVP